MGFDKQHALQVLSFWLQTEFFNTLDLKALLPGGDDGALQFTTSELLNEPQCLPWFKRQRIRAAGKHYHPDKAYSYTLYLGIFNRNEFAQQAKEYFDIENTALAHSFDNEDWQQRRDDNGITCCAKLKLNSKAELQLDSLEMSTAPWALGKLLQGQIDALSKEAFDKDVESFKDQLQLIHRLASNIKQETSTNSAFTSFELFEILKRLSNWAGFRPAETRFGLIVQLQPERKDTTAVTLPELPANSIVQLKRLSDLIKKDEVQPLAVATEQTTKAVSSEQEAEGFDIPILNSFFVDDIAKAIQRVKNDKLLASSPLASFLVSKPSYYADLLSEPGSELVKQQLNLANTPLGRWPDTPDHTMSLMQQFAINSVGQHLSAGGLFSVNGPPGTGKTTMLRDIIADNMVKRGQVLANLTKASAAFVGDKTIVAGDKSVTVKQLSPELVGYEMLVVSNNNTAVENITKELPQTKALGEGFAKLAYLKASAQKVAAPVNEINKVKHLHALSEADDCWGLVAAALGNSDNRKQFCNKLFFEKTSKMQCDDVSSQYLTLVDTIKGIADKAEPQQAFSFAQAEFTKAEQAVNEAISGLQRLEAIEHNKRKLHDLQLNCLAHHAIYKKALACLAKLELKCLPWWHYRVVKACKKRAVVKAYRRSVALKKAKREQLQSEYTLFSSKLKQEINDCKDIANLHHDVVFASAQSDLESPNIQRKAFGHSQLLNQLRSQLSVKAFELHQAWLVAAYKSNRVYASTVNTLSNLLKNDIASPEHAKVMWQNLFMVCPVVSSSFASVANQFSKLDEGDIGWLFIDEAGQATPPQAVGALLRAKHAVVVGDPLQVEPVFTTPPAIVEYLGKGMLGNKWITWSPSIASVQELADRANPFGTKQIAEGRWLGSPLRVHRRCSNPMFSIANHIAYNNKMIHGLNNIEESPSFVWGTSCWIDVSGKEQGKHYVPEQAEQVLRMLNLYVDEHGQLPDCYIISPFSKVKYAVNQYLKRHFSHPKVSSSQFKEWVKGRIGTVHTFQGKEEKLVIFVLGASDSKSAAKWAASKPNLLNVALTRAKKRVYVIGCSKVWSSLPYFSDAFSLLAESNSEASNRETMCLEG